jgi:hypothetical protein
MAPRFLRGFFLRGLREEASRGGRTTDWISSELMMRVRSLLVMGARGSL